MNPRLCVVVFTILIGVAIPGYAQQRFITDMDLQKFVWIADSQISPDGAQIAFVRVSVNARGDGYDTGVWLAAPGAEPRRLTMGPGDVSPRWSPDGKALAFVRARQIHVLALEGGEPIQLTDVPRGVGALEWSPDGQTIAFTTTTAPEDFSAPTTGYKSDVRVITRAVYRANGVGYLDPSRPAHIWTIPVVRDAAARPQPKQVTSGEFEESNIAWSRDGQRILFISTRTAEPYYEPSDSNVYSVSREGGASTVVADINGPISSYTLSHDGRRIAFIGSLHRTPARSFNQPDLFVSSLNGAPKNLTAAYDFDIGAALTGDQRAPRGALPAGAIWTKDGRSLIVVAAEQGRSNLKRIDAESGRMENLTTGDQALVSYTAAGDKLAVLISTATNIGDLFTMDIASAQLTRVTNVNQPLFSSIRLTAPEEFWYQTSDGKRIQGWIQKPPDFDPTLRYPLILDVHGGPHAAWGATFMHEFQWMAAKGYVVVYVNPRGSSTYGDEFANEVLKPDPSGEFIDLMAGVDEVIKRGYIDANRLGVTGGSYGGYLTNWIVTQTDRFKAAVSQRSIADRAIQWYTTDGAIFQAPEIFGPSPFENPAGFARRSPLTFVAKVTTPIMFIEGEADFRVTPGAGGEPMFRALKYLKRETVMVRFPDESHDLSRSGKPWHRVERLQHIVGYFDRFLKSSSN